MSVLFFLLAVTTTVPTTQPMIRYQLNDKHELIWLGWRSDGGRELTNLLRPKQSISLAQWKVTNSADQLDFTAEKPSELRLPFNPTITPVTVLSWRWDDKGRFELPAILHAPDFGTLLVTSTQPVHGRLEGSRPDKRVEVIFEAATDLRFKAWILPPPPGLKDESLWPQARTGWLNAIQATSAWGDQSNPFSAPAGILGNNVVSDPASCSLWFYADQCFLHPEPAPGVNLMPMVRRSVEYWMDHRMVKDAAGRETGELVGYWSYANFLDSNPSALIASWDYVEATNDQRWLTDRIAKLEQLAEFLASRDVDHDGMLEAVQSGNAGTLQQPNRSCAWWDAINCGHKDAYTNAIAYRAFRCVADLEKKLNRSSPAQRYTTLADNLKAAYAKNLLNPQTGWLAWWKSADGKLHDYASPVINGLAIDYGLVPPDQAKEILDRLWKKIEQAGFARFDLGVPCALTPVRREDYLLPDAIGCPKNEDGSDTFQIYMNGAVTPGHVLHFIDALYVTGQRERADLVLNAMLQRQAKGLFENGVTDSAMKGIDWTTWNGQPAGYEGYLADSYRFIQAALLREPALRHNLLRPLNEIDN